jgi:hypothetical protein
MKRRLYEAFGYDEDTVINDEMDVDDIPSSQDYMPFAKIIFITTHGELLAKKNEGLFEPKLVSVPDNMEVIKITATAPGVTNIADENDIISYHNSILEVLEKLRNPNAPILELNQILNELIKEFQKAFQEQLKIKNTQIFDRSAETDFYLRDFKRHSNKAFQVNYLKPGESIADKEYSRTEDDYKTVFDFRILNMPSVEDFLQEDNDEITTEELMNHFAANGTRRLIIFDFSCSTCFIDSERNMRNVRRDILNNNACGGKRRRTRRSNKKKRKTQNKKRRATRKK